VHLKEAFHEGELIGNSFKKFVLFVLIALLMLASEANQSLASEMGKLAFVRDGNIWIGNTDGTDVRQLTSFSRQSGASGPSLSLDGKLVAFAHNRRICFMSTGGGQPKAISSSKLTHADSVSFSPDGRYLVFRGHSECRKNKYGMDECLVSIWLAGLSDHSLKKVLSHRAAEEGMDIMPAPNMAPDGQLIVYTESDHEPTWGFRVINLQGQEVFRYPPDPGDPKPYQFARFSPDGQKFICYSYDFSEAKRHEIYLVSMKDKSRRKITEGSAPIFVDGGAAIVFVRNQGLPGNRYQPDLYRMDLTPDAQPRKIIANADQPG